MGLLEPLVFSKMKSICLKLFLNLLALITALVIVLLTLIQILFKTSTIFWNHISIILSFIIFYLDFFKLEQSSILLHQYRYQRRVFRPLNYLPPLHVI